MQIAAAKGIASLIPEDELSTTKEEEKDGISYKYVSLKHFPIVWKVFFNKRMTSELESCHRL
ncbi:hypothetical protein [Streptococcus uberis]|uniref:hypothetical protein n=1 Tax=Streptococcus uberis TaxID=1349 RepID=UPI001FF3D421|nr:hypothetical protein [Streptococcus uberis]